MCTFQLIKVKCSDPQGKGCKTLFNDFPNLFKSCHSQSPFRCQIDWTKEVYEKKDVACFYCVSPQEKINLMDSAFDHNYYQRSLCHREVELQKEAQATAWAMASGIDPSKGVPPGLREMAATGVIPPPPSMPPEYVAPMPYFFMPHMQPTPPPRKPTVPQSTRITYDHPSTYAYPATFHSPYPPPPGAGLQSANAPWTANVAWARDAPVSQGPAYVPREYRSPRTPSKRDQRDHYKYENRTTPRSNKHSSSRRLYADEAMTRQELREENRARSNRSAVAHTQRMMDKFDPEGRYSNNAETFPTKEEEQSPSHSRKYRSSGKSQPEIQKRGHSKHHSKSRKPPKGS